MGSNATLGLSFRVVVSGHDLAEFTRLRSIHNDNRPLTKEQVEKLFESMPADTPYLRLLA